MRYLYGDSTPVPLAYDFLGTLESFMTAATRAVKAHDDAVALEAKAAEAQKTRLAGIHALEGGKEWTPRKGSMPSRQISSDR